MRRIWSESDVLKKINQHHCRYQYHVHHHLLKPKTTNRIKKSQVTNTIPEKFPATHHSIAGRATRPRRATRLWLFTYRKSNESSRAKLSLRRQDRLAMSNLQEGNPNFVLLIQQEMDIITAMRRGQPLTPAHPKVLFPTLIVPSRDEMATIARQYDPNISSFRPGQFECLADLIQQTKYNCNQSHRRWKNCHLVVA